MLIEQQIAMAETATPRARTWARRRVCPACRTEPAHNDPRGGRCACGHLHPDDGSTLMVVDVAR